MEQPVAFRTVGNRCAFIFEDMVPGVSQHSIFAALEGRGCSIIETDVVATARSVIGASRYRRGATLREAPEVFDCSSFTKWCYGRCGIHLPRLSIQQRGCGRPTAMAGLRAGDMLFTVGWRNWYDEGGPSNGVGHVYLATGERSFVHASARNSGVAEVSEEDVFGRHSEEELRGCRRLLPERPWRTVVLPEELEIESADDLVWKVRMWTWEG